MRVSLDLNYSAFDTSCSATVTKVGNGSRKALLAACEEIWNRSSEQVPVDTLTLLTSLYYEITGDYRTGWEARIGYGGNGDPVNPKTGKRASSYMLAVHEDLTAYHPHGKAKFLEDPIREFAGEKFPRTVFKYIQSAL